MGRTFEKLNVAKQRMVALRLGTRERSAPMLIFHASTPPTADGSLESFLHPDQAPSQNRAWRIFRNPDAAIGVNFISVVDGLKAVNPESKRGKPSPLQNERFGCPEVGSTCHLTHFNRPQLFIVFCRSTNSKSSTLSHPSTRNLNCPSPRIYPP